jgi:hypothetical protein
MRHALYLQRGQHIEQCIAAAVLIQVCAPQKRMQHTTSLTAQRHSLLAELQNRKFLPAVAFITVATFHAL